MPYRQTLPASTDADQRDWLATAARHGAGREQALSVFDGLAPVAVEAMQGRWRGRGVPTGHPLDGMLEAFGWHGKIIEAPDRVHPLVFGSGANLVALDPKRLPVTLAARLQPQRSRLARLAFRAGRPLLTTTAPAARLRTTCFRGVCSATIIYDALPINDVFRAAGPDTLLGLMDCRYFDEPFFFVLSRE